MTIKHISRAALAAALAALAVWGATSVTAAPFEHKHDRAGKTKIDRQLTRQLAQMRVATAKYATDLEAAKADGYRIITPMMRDMGFHYLNPAITDFDPARPPILVYVRRDGQYQLGALEWVFPKKPAKPPLKGAKYGSFPAACHYDDGTFTPAGSEADCPKTSPETGTPFVFWHPRLVTLHVWVWYPNPDGLYAGTNPLVRPFNGG
ncbi:MAG TPA: hypothetical protein VNO82_18135 [Solirubrobacteraceae bacterium]|nr:hypothetical protein [Solirubrobacteraceae bacterium]